MTFSSSRHAGALREDQVVLVDDDGNETGVGDKTSAHLLRLRHKAVSVFLFTRERQQLLLQRRALGKYHSGGLWTNSACTHPRPGESVPDAAARAIDVELGLSADLQPVLVASYDLQVSASMYEKESNHVYGGVCALDALHPNAKEVEDVRLIDIDQIMEFVRENSTQCTAWFKYLAVHHLGEVRNVCDQSGSRRCRPSFGTSALTCTQAGLPDG